MVITPIAGVGLPPPGNDRSHIQPGKGKAGWNHQLKTADREKDIKDMLVKRKVFKTKIDAE